MSIWWILAAGKYDQNDDDDDDDDDDDGDFWSHMITYAEALNDDCDDEKAKP